MNLLFVNSCISQRGAQSRTRTLCRAFFESYRETHPETVIETVDLVKLDLKPFKVPMLDERTALAEAGAFDGPVFALARQFQAADRIVIGAPLWDLSFPALLRIYIEHISVSGLLYHYDEQGVHGDCRASRLAYLSTGGDFDRACNLGVEHWRQLSEMFGIPQFDSVFAAGLDVDPDPARVSELLSKACAQAGTLAKTF